jgi:UDP-glucuronate 4-epimerase
MRILVTGCAGFIGFHLTKRLLDQGDDVLGLDNLNDYYDPKLKHARLAQLNGRPGFRFHSLDVGDRGPIADLFRTERPQRVIHLAAQAGVRYSLTNPQAYVDSNLVGFLHILEGCRHHEVEHLTYASSSSVYGANTLMPFSVTHKVNHPLSLYAATKKANELMAHTYSHLYGLPTTGLRFFTVYGPWGRPDMALFLFTKAILNGQPIDIFNEGNMQRDFTYIDDIVESVVRISNQVAKPNPAWNGDDPDPASSKAPYRLFNIGNNNPVELLCLIKVLEKCLGRKARKRFLPMQLGDVPSTFADVEDLGRAIGFKPSTPIEHGVSRFVDWYLSYYRMEIVKTCPENANPVPTAEAEHCSTLGGFTTVSDDRFILSRSLAGGDFPMGRQH